MVDKLNKQIDAHDTRIMKLSGKIPHVDPKN